MDNFKLTVELQISTAKILREPIRDEFEERSELKVRGSGVRLFTESNDDDKIIMNKIDLSSSEWTRQTPLPGRPKSSPIKNYVCTNILRICHNFFL